MQVLKIMARPKGFEPLTHGLEGRCSIQLSYGRVSKEMYYTPGGTCIASQELRKDGP